MILLQGVVRYSKCMIVDNYVLLYLLKLFLKLQMGVLCRQPFAVLIIHGFINYEYLNFYLPLHSRLRRVCFVCFIEEKQAKQQKVA